MTGVAVLILMTLWASAATLTGLYAWTEMLRLRRSHRDAIDVVEQQSQQIAWLRQVARIRGKGGG